ncbi:MAG: precorrin-6B methylase [Firmicutes bacterium]|nr:precorrin-6B methylase [Bacillota bacterium]
MAKDVIFTNDVILKWLQYFAENTPIDLEQIKMMDVTKKNMNIIPTVESHKAVLAFMEAGDTEVFYRMWNAGLGDCEVWYNEGSEPVGEIKHDDVRFMIDRGINASAGMLVVNPNAVSTNKSGLGDVTQRVSSKQVGNEIRTIILSKMRIDAEDTVCVVGGEVIAIDAAFQANEGTVIAVEYNGKQRAALEDNVEFYDLRNVKIIDRVDEESMEGLPAPDIAFIVASASLQQEIDLLMKLNRHIILVVYTLDFVEAGKLRDMFDARGIKDAEVIRIGIDRMNPNNVFEREPAPWIVSGRIEKE